VLPVESVLAVLEVKSMLEKKHVSDFNANLAKLNTFDRYYVPTELFRNTGDMKGTMEYKAFIDHSIKPVERLFGVSPIRGGIFAFDGPAPATVKTWLADVAIEKNFAFICVLGKFSAYPEHKLGRWHLAERGEDTFALFATTFLELINSNEREVHVKADSNRYIDMAARAAQL